MSNECIICFESMTATDKTATCAGCTTIVHANCFKQWRDKKKGKCVPCIYCQQFDTIVYYTPPSAFQKFCKKCIKFFSS